MKIKEMYDSPRYPNHYIVELMDGSARLFYMIPFRRITEKDLRPCIATPKQIGGSPVESHLLQAYGLQREERS